MSTWQTSINPAVLSEHGYFHMCPAGVESEAHKDKSLLKVYVAECGGMWRAPVRVVLAGAQRQCGDTPSIAPLSHSGACAWSCMAPCRPTKAGFMHLSRVALACVGDEMPCCVASC